MVASVCRSLSSWSAICSDWLTHLEDTLVDLELQPAERDVAMGTEADDVEIVQC